MIIKLQTIFVVIVLVLLPFDVGGSRRIKRDDELCGISGPNSSDGSNFFNGQWPFIAAVYYVNVSQIYFICGGTIISRSFVITAANCIISKGENYARKAQDIKVRPGAFNLINFLERQSLFMTPSQIILHPDWKPFNQNFDADVALLRMQNEIRFSQYIKPICMFQQTDTVSGIRDGWLIGWGHTTDFANRLNALPRKIRIPIIDTRTCSALEPRYANQVSARTFCAGSKVSNSVCQNDVGSGLFVSFNGRFHLGGIASVSISNNFGYCDVNNIAIFTNVHLMSRWIQYYNGVQGPQQQVQDQGTSQGRPQQASYQASPQALNQASPLQVRPQSQQIQQQSNFVTPPIKAPSTGNNLLVIKPSPSPPRRTQPVIKCGIMSDPEGLVQGGRRVSDNQFPWAAAVYRKNSLVNYGIDYAIGSLISSRHIYIEALFLSLVDDAKNILPNLFPTLFPTPEEIRVFLGFDDLEQVNDATTSSLVSKINVHPKYKIGVPLQANLAILTLQNAVTFSKTISPVCIWDGSSDLAEIIGKNAIGFGYGGQSKASTTKYKKSLVYKIKDRSECSADYKIILRNVKDKSPYFCAGGDTGESLCVGDNLSLYLKKDEAWFIVATVAFHEISTRTRFCNIDKPGMFEHLGEYTKWINDIVESN